MGFDDHEEENQNGRYQVIIDSKGDQYWYDTRYGDKVAIGSKSYGYILLKEKGGMKERFDKEFELVDALKELDLSLRKFDAIDPVKYDFALFGLGRYESF